MQQITGDPYIRANEKTGGAGFIGNHLVKRLLDEGREVVVADDFSRGNMLNLTDLGVGINCEKVDLRDYSHALKVLDGADAVNHLAQRVRSVEYNRLSIRQVYVSLEREAQQC